MKREQDIELSDQNKRILGISIHILCLINQSNTQSNKK